MDSDLLQAALYLLELLAAVDWQHVLTIAYGWVASYWYVVQIVLIATAVVIFVSSAEDVIVDLGYWLIALLRFERHPRVQTILDEPERHAAVLIPAWQESDVIARMLLNTVNRFTYKRFDIFVGVYPNDPRTQSEVDNVAANFGNVHRVDVSHPGPTNKADCLNHLIEGVLALEKKTETRFEMFVNHDAEDVVHPLGLKVMNYFLEGRGMVQLPVRSLDRSQTNFVACSYMDEFAEWHTKDLVVRSVLSGMTPSAGVGTAFSREAIDALKATGQIFNDESLTEDYDVAHRLRQLGFRSRFVRYWAKMPGSRTRELVDTREYFPHRVANAVRQKARWMLGISYMGWRQLGWHGDLVNRYFLWRDRKSLITASAAVLGYILALHWLIYGGLIATLPSFVSLPPLITEPWVWTLVYVNLALLANRLAHRALFVGLAHGVRYVPLSPVRAVVGNFIAFFAFLRAQRQFMGHVFGGQKLTWDKTRHRFPSAEELRNGYQRLGDIVTYWSMVTPAELQTALEHQRKTGRPLGLQLLDDGAIDDASLAQAFAELLRVDSASFDPLRINDRVRNLLPRNVAGQLGAFVIERPTRRSVVVALSEPLSSAQARLLGRMLKRRGIRSVTYRFAPLSDIAFGVRFAYDPAPLSEEIAQVARLRHAGRFTDADERALWRVIRKDYQRLGDILVRQDSLKHKSLISVVRRSAKGRPLGTRLRLQRLVSGGALRQALELQLKPPIDVLGLAARAGLVREQDVDDVRRSRRRERRVFGGLFNVPRGQVRDANERARRDGDAGARASAREREVARSDQTTSV